MSPQNVVNRYWGWIFGLLLAFGFTGPPTLDGQELELLRDYPGSGPYQCLAPVTPALPTPDDRARASQLASDANQALIFGDLERVQELLEQAVALDPSSADLAYRHAVILEDLERTPAAMAEYCRALDLDVEALGIFEARDRLTALSNQLRDRIPQEARDAFAEGLRQADDSLYVEAARSFTTAMNADPEWPEPIYNRAVANERGGRPQAAIQDWRRYLQLVAPDETEAIMVSERIGELEGAASVGTPNPLGALALGLVPGMGHYYTSRPIMGTLMLGTAALALSAGFGYQEITTLCLSDVASGAACPSADIVDEITERPYFWIGVGVAGAVAVVGAVDAYIRARSERNAFLELTAPVPTDATLEVGPTLNASPGRVDLQFLRLRFR